MREKYKCSHSILHRKYNVETTYIRNKVSTYIIHGRIINPDFISFSFIGQPERELKTNLLTCKKRVIGDDERERHRNIICSYLEREKNGLLRLKLSIIHDYVPYT